MNVAALIRELEALCGPRPVGVAPVKVALYDARRRALSEAIEAVERYADRMCQRDSERDACRG